MDDWSDFGQIGQPVVSNPPDRLPEFAQAIEQFAPGFSRFLPTTDEAQDWVSSIAQAAAAVELTRAQRELLQIQMDRARAGLPPLDSSQYGLGASVGISRDTILMIGGVGVGLLVLWSALRRR